MSVRVRPAVPICSVIIPALARPRVPSERRGIKYGPGIASVAQWTEPPSPTRQVNGSNPFRSSKLRGRLERFQLGLISRSTRCSIPAPATKTCGSWPSERRRPGGQALTRKYCPVIATGFYPVINSVNGVCGFESCTGRHYKVDGSVASASVKGTVFSKRGPNELH